MSPESTDFFERAEKAEGYSAQTILRELQTGFNRTSDVDESERYSFEWFLLEDWARERGLCFNSPGDGVQADGGHEHDVYLRNGYCFKKTKWDTSGLIYDPDISGLRNATVSEYLKRIHLQDILFLSDTEILGVVIQGRSRAILSRQRLIEGVIPDASELHNHLIAMKADCLQKGDAMGYCGAVYKLLDLFYVADVRADNCRIIYCRDNETCLASFDLIISTTPEGDKWLDENLA